MSAHTGRGYPVEGAQRQLLSLLTLIVSQFFDDIRDVIRKAPKQELIDLPEGHEAKRGTLLVKSSKCCFCQ